MSQLHAHTAVIDHPSFPLPPSPFRWEEALLIDEAVERLVALDALIIIEVCGYGGNKEAG